MERTDFKMIYERIDSGFCRGSATDGEGRSPHSPPTNRTSLSYENLIMTRGVDHNSSYTPLVMATCNRHRPRRRGRPPASSTVVAAESAVTRILQRARMNQTIM
jgi:hypothetical protein